MDVQPRRLPRLPLPAKLLISYLVVISIGAVPTFLYVRNKLQADLIELAQGQLTEGVRRAGAGLLSFHDDDAVQARTRSIASVLRQRVTLIAPSGEVLFDSEALTHDNHLSRPEVQSALLARPLVDVQTARRVSASTHKDTLYAATRLSADGPVLRLAETVDEVQEVARAMKSFARNVQAIAVSIAFGFSLLAAVLFLRPLQRLQTTAKIFATGDLSARSGNVADDEVGDVARALDAMAVDLRRRLANAGSGDALLSQLVDALPVPCVIVEPSTDGKHEVLALNGPARRALRVEGQSARRKVQEIVTSGRFKRALDEAEADGDPEPCMLYVDDNVRFEALVHVLKRPGAAPLTVILGHESPALSTTTLPMATTVLPRPFEAVLSEAKERAKPLLAGVMIEVDDNPGVLVADVDQRLSHALALAFEMCGKALAGKADILAVDVHVEPTRVRLALDALPGADFLDAVRPLIAPLGGDVSVDDGCARVWLPRA